MRWKTNVLRLCGLSLLVVVDAGCGSKESPQQAGPVVQASLSEAPEVASEREGAHAGAGDDALTCAGCAQGTQATDGDAGSIARLRAAVAPEDRKMIGILAFDTVLASDVTAPLEVFGAAKSKAWFAAYDVQLIGLASSPTVTTAEGFKLLPDSTTADSGKLEALIVPGSYEIETLLKDESLVGFIRERSSKVSWLASNCAGAFLLGAVGALDGRRATTFSGGAEMLAESVPKVKADADASVVVDGNLITSNGSVVSYVSALVLLGKMTSRDHAKEIFDYLQLPKLVEWQVVDSLL